MAANIIVEEAIPPGDLVYGGDLNYLSSFLSKGIKTAAGAERETDWPTWHNICFALLPNRPFPTRYYRAHHFAPGGDMGMKSLGIVVATADILPLFPEQIFAIGENFWDPQHRPASEIFYRFQEDQVSGIPIKKHGCLHYRDEVRVYPVNPLEANVPPYTWKAITIHETSTSTLRALLGDFHSDQLPQIPVISSYGKLLFSNLKEVTL